MKGSTLRIDALSTKEIVKAEIVMEDGKQLPLKIDGKKLQGNLVLFQSQQYRILVQDAQGFRNSPIAYELKVKPDGFHHRPAATDGGFEVNGDEVLTLEYSARDDFGISEVNLVAKEIAKTRFGCKGTTPGGRTAGPVQMDRQTPLADGGDEAVFHLKCWTTTPSQVRSSASPDPFDCGLRISRANTSKSPT